MTPLLAEASTAVASSSDAKIWMGVLIGVLVGVVVQAFAAWLRGSAATREKLEEKAEQVIAEKFDGLAAGITGRLDSHGERLDDVEERLKELGEERHQHEIKVANELNAVRVAIAQLPTKHDHATLAEKLDALNNRVTELAASRRPNNN